MSKLVFFHDFFTERPIPSSSESTDFPPDPTVNERDQALAAHDCLEELAHAPHGTGLHDSHVGPEGHANPLEDQRRHVRE